MRRLKVYWDTNVFIRMVESTDNISEQLNQVLDVAFAAGAPIVTSELTLAELLVDPLRAGDQLRIAAYRTLLEPGSFIEVQPVSRNVLEGAAEVRATWSTAKLPDAIHVATAEIAGCKVFLSSDRRLPAHSSLALTTPDHASLQELIARFRD